MSASSLNDILKVLRAIFGICGYLIDHLEYRILLTFIFAINEINGDPGILPNVTLGYHVYDSCGDIMKAIDDILKILSGNKRDVPNYSCWEQGKVAGFIGDRQSITTLPVAQILGLYGYTQISYGATDPLLSDRVLYPYFFRTVQDDHIRYTAILKLLQYFGWNWVGIITSDDESGEKELRELSQKITRHGICIEFVIKISSRQKHSEHYLASIEKSTSQVLITCGTCSAHCVRFVLTSESIFQNITIILKTSWTYVLYLDLKTVKPFNNSLSFVSPTNQVPGVNNLMHSFHPSNRPNDSLLEDIWLIRLRCLSPNLYKNKVFQYLFNFTAMNCTGKERSLDYIDNSQSLVYNAVYILAHALHNMHAFLENKYPEIDPLRYDYKNKIPRARCNDYCLPGFRKAWIGAHHTCCYDCLPCSQGEISSITDSNNCQTCPDNEWPDKRKVKCVPKTYEFLSYGNEIMSPIFCSISLFFSAISFLILRAFILFHDTPIVRANNCNLSFLLLVSIMLSFLCVFLFLGRPVDITCMLRQTSFGIIFSVALSSILAKTIMVYIAFKAAKPGSSWRKWVGVKVSHSVVLKCTTIQIMINVIWLSISPPFQEFDMHSYPGIIIIQCNEGSVIAFYCVLGYMGILAALSLVLAFMVRTLPDSFNEAKYITFSMLVFCSVWIAMIPAYLSTKGKYMVAVEIFAILASSTGILGCIFFPKCYILLIKPEMNTKKHILDRHKF
ncbi:G-protein coupled receptor family C group 6 member A-like [Pelobates fuscus]|uniref:G-protein coupled receptor family C group 6 member A-like n=1 Tax=Pelobates fuscus TaxID=191477 RepID=UPI002FE4D600